MSAPQPPQSPEPPPLAPNVSRQFATIVYTAFGIVAALAWSDALSNMFKSFGFGPFAYAAVVTLMAYAAGRVLASMLVPTCTRLCPPTRKDLATAAPTSPPPWWPSSPR
jgi:hypothetical protein